MALAIGGALAVGLSCSVEERLDPVGPPDAGTGGQAAAASVGGAGAAGSGALGGGGAGGRPAGALVRVTMESRVGVLLDELPLSMRDRVADAILAEPPSFWS